MSSMIQVTINAFGDEHTFIDSYVEGDIDIIVNAPVLYLISGSDEKINALASDKSVLNSDWTVLHSEAGEYVFFGYEYFTKDQDFMIDVLDLCYEREERSEDEMAA